MSTREIRTESMQLRGRSFVGWGAIFSGALIGVATMALLSSLWLGSGGANNWVGNNIEWFIGGSGIFSMFVAGFFAGWFAGGRGFGHGFIHGLTEWGLFTAAAILVLPGLVGLFGVGAVGNVAPGTNVIGGAMYTMFWSLLIGLGASVLGGVVGGLLPAPGMRRHMDVVREREHRVA